MKSILLLTLLLPATGSEIEWKSDLAEAAVSAKKQEKLVLLRQVICACDGSDCDTMDIAKSPRFMEDHARRHVVKENFVFVLQHTTRKNMSEGLKFDPEFNEKEKKETSIRTLFLTSSLHVLHRFDLCKRNWDADVEVEFALKLAGECYEKNGTPLKGSISKLMALQDDHYQDPEKFHEKNRPGRPSGCDCEERKVGLSGSKKTWKGHNETISWHKDLDEAKKLAQKKGKLILFYQVVGDLSKEGC